MNNKNKTFETTDFAISCYLYAKNIPLLDVQPTTTPKKSTFVFQHSDAITDLLQAFWSSKENISAMKLINAERELKKRLYSDAYKAS